MDAVRTISRPRIGSRAGVAPAPKAHHAPRTRNAPVTDFPIIGIGASAGGLEAFEQFFRNLPAENGMAFILVPHLAPDHASLLTEILQRCTSMSVVEVRDGMTVAPNSVYVIPPNRELALVRGALRLVPPDRPRGQRTPIDSFLCSLADELGERAIGVILSGTGADGTLGLCAIHGAGGISFVQEPASAQYDGMPLSAMRSGLATYVLPAGDMPARLQTYVRTLYHSKTRPAPVPDDRAASALRRVVAVLRARTGHDFALYKQSTIARRIERRMAVLALEDLDGYGRYLSENAQEPQILFKELLINVTSFFRDPAAFEALDTAWTRLLFDRKSERTDVRVWVPACSTGEEAYSIAMLLRERMDERKAELKVQIYATDIDEAEIAHARAGLYPATIAGDLSPERLRRFFVEDETGYRIRKSIRETIVFATHDLIKGPPFSRMDLVSCRNLLIYLEPELQDRVLATLHYALKPGGILFLSPSEGIGRLTDLFAPLDRKHRLYVTRAGAARTRGLLVAGPPPREAPRAAPASAGGRKGPETQLEDLTRRALLQAYAPPSVITDPSGNILFVHGDTGRYLQPAPGRPRLNLIEMARPDLPGELRDALRDAAARKTVVFRKNLSVRSDRGVRTVHVAVRPLLGPESNAGLLLVSFNEPSAGPRECPPAPPTAAGRSTRRVRELERELLLAKDSLQASLEEHQAGNEELQSINEEAQSTNEELVTVTAELQAQITALTATQNDVKNLLDNTQIGTVFLDGRLVVRRFNREATRMFRLLAIDVGRPFADIRSNFEGGEELLEDARAVLQSFQPRERQVRVNPAVAAEGLEWDIVRTMPYRTIDNVIDGVVLTFTDITATKVAAAEVQAAREYAENIVDTVREPLLVLDGQLKVISANRSFCRTFGVSAQEAAGRLIYELGGAQWNLPRLRELLEGILPRENSVEDLEVEHEFRDLGRRTLLLNARRIVGRAGATPLILLAMEDVTGSRPKDARQP